MRRMRVKNRPDASAEFVIMAIVETLEIDLVEIDPRAEVFEYLRRAVAIGDEAGERVQRPWPL